MEEQHKQTFLAKLRTFKSSRGEDTEPPSFAKRAVDQFKLWTAVQEAGGHSEVTASKGWARIGRMFDPPKTMTDLSFRIKKIYELNLLPFEKAVLDGNVEGVFIPPRAVQPQASNSAQKSRAGRPSRKSAGTNQGSGKRSRQDNKDEMVGKRIRVLWPDERQFFSGTVTLFDPQKGKHKIDYDDGDEEFLDLTTQTWHLVDDSGNGKGNALRLVDNGGLGQLHSAAEALAKSDETQLPVQGSYGDLGEDGAHPLTEKGCVMEGDGYKVFETQEPDSFEVFCLIPGLQLEEIRVQCWSSGKVLVTREPRDSRASSPWGIRPLRHKIRLPRPVHAESARALVTLHGQLYVKIFCEPPIEEDATAELGSGVTKLGQAAAEGEPRLSAGEEPQADQAAADASQREPAKPNAEQAANPLSQQPESALAEGTTAPRHENTAPRTDAEAAEAVGMDVDIAAPAVGAAADGKPSNEPQKAEPAPAPADEMAQPTATGAADPQQQLQGAEIALPAEGE